MSDAAPEDLRDEMSAACDLVMELGRTAAFRYGRDSPVALRLGAAAQNLGLAEIYDTERRQAKALEAAAQSNPRETR